MWCDSLCVCALADLGAGAEATHSFPLPVFLQFFSSRPAMGAHPLLPACHGGRLAGRVSGWHHSVQRVAKGVDRWERSGSKWQCVPVSYNCPWEEGIFLFFFILPLLSPPSPLHIPFPPSSPLPLSAPPLSFFPPLVFPSLPSFTASLPPLVRLGVWGAL